MNGNIELLAPAGSYENFKAALSAGADAVYLGGDLFSARAYADNFDKTKLLYALDYAHLHGRRVYMTVNTLLKEQELKGQLVDFLRPYYENGLDGVIIQDMGVAKFIMQHFKGLACHASTQMSVTGAEGAKYLKELGFTRVVPARELSLEEIKAVYDETGMEIECFIHGALCYCYSGQCLLSGMIGGRSGNRGRCAQPCRLEYSLMNQDNLRMADCDTGKYLLSPKDMATLSILPDLIENGVYSMKIEGRMKSREYTAGVVSIYRRYLDLYFEKGRKEYKVSPKDITDLMDLYNRGGFNKGYYKSCDGSDMMSTKRPNHAGVEAIKVQKISGGKVTFLALTDLYKGDVFEITKDFNLTSGIDVGKGSTFTMQVPARYISKCKRTYPRIKCARLLNEIDEAYVSDKELIKEDVECECTVRAGQRTELMLRLKKENDLCVNVKGAEAGTAKNRPVSVADIKKQLQKLGETPFRFKDSKDIKVVCDENVFVPVMVLNELRRNAVDMLVQKISDSKKRVVSNEASFAENDLKPEGIKKVSDFSVGILVSTKEQLTELTRFIKGKGQLFNGISKKCTFDRLYVDYNCFYDDTINDLLSEFACICGGAMQIYAALPRVMRQNRMQQFEDLLERIKNCGIKGFLVRNLEELAFLKEKISNDSISECTLVCDYSLYVWNNPARAAFMENADGFTAPLELNSNEIKQLEPSGMELLVYGYFPVMVSAQCVKKTLGKCDGKMSEVTISDRKNAKYCVSSQCRFCHSVMYYDKPLYLMEFEDELQTRRIRYDFTVETPQKMIEVLTDKADDYTMGHFKKGVL